VDLVCVVGWVLKVVGVGRGGGVGRRKSCYKEEEGRGKISVFGIRQKLIASKREGRKRYLNPTIRRKVRLDGE
jgi:hypothetical protein